MFLGEFPGHPQGPVAQHRQQIGEQLQQPVGRFKLNVCTNLPCALSGANEAAEHLKKRLGIGWNGTTADGQFTLKEGECFGACGDAPVILHNNRKMLVGMTPAKIDELLAELAK